MRDEQITPTWPSVTPVLGRKVEGVEWRDGKPRCSTHHGCLVPEPVPGLTDGGTHVCPVCVRTHLGKSTPVPNASADEVDR